MPFSQNFFPKYFDISESLLTSQKPHDRMYALSVERGKKADSNCFANGLIFGLLAALLIQALNWHGCVERRADSAPGDFSEATTPTPAYPPLPTPTRGCESLPAPTRNYMCDRQGVPWGDIGVICLPVPTCHPVAPGIFFPSDSGHLEENLQ